MPSLSSLTDVTNAVQTPSAALHGYVRMSPAPRSPRQLWTGVCSQFSSPGNARHGRCPAGPSTLITAVHPAARLVTYPGSCICRGEAQAVDASLPFSATSARASFAGLPVPAGGDRRGCALVVGYRDVYRDVEEVLIDRGIEVDHVTVYRWVRGFTVLFVDAAGPCRQAPDDRWFVDETPRSSGAGSIVWAIDQYGRVIDALVSDKRDLAATAVSLPCLQSRLTAGEHRSRACLSAGTG